MNLLKHLQPLPFRFSMRYSYRPTGKRQRALSLFQPLLVLVMLLAGTNVGTLSAQATYDGNGAGVSGTSLPFTVPAGTDRLLVISLSYATFSPLTNVSYNSISATLAIAQPFSTGFAVSSIYYIPLGSGASISSAITITGGTSVVVGAASFQNIDQASPLGNTAGIEKVSTSTPSLNLSSTAGNLIVDNMFCSLVANPVTATTPIFSIDDSPDDFASSFQIAASGTNTMSYTFGTGATDQYTYAAAEFIASSSETNINQAVADLKDYINSADISGGTARAITRRLDLAAYRFCNGYPVSYVISTLNSIIDYVEYQSGEDIPTADADHIIAEIQALISALNSGTVVCDPVPNRPAASNVINAETELDTGIKLFPNPVRNTVNISLKEQLGKPALIRIYGMQGQLMAERNYQSLEQGELTFDVSRFANGNYTLMVSVDGDVPVMKKFAVQK